MAYVALYRAYRPQSFDEVVGQKHIIKTLQNAITLNKVAHAYLFCGPRGTGKTTLAKIMAKAMNCENGPTPNPCCNCSICKSIKDGTMPDVIEIDAASNNGADDIRQIRDTVKYLPAMGKYKVYIIDEVHMLSTAAFNALLKTLEEPPKHVIFILATTEPYKLPATILSRCQRFDFESISKDDILSRLNIVAKEENINIDKFALFQIATSAEGGMRDALSLFDQCISYSTSDSITLDDVISVSGNISYLKIIELLSSCRDQDETKAIDILASTLKEGKEIPRVINDIILFLRDTLMYKSGVNDSDNPMFSNKDYQVLASNLSKPLIYQWINILNDALNGMRYSTEKRAYIELAVLKMNDSALNKEADLEDKVLSLEKNISYLNDEIERLKKQGVRVEKEKNNLNINIPSMDEINKLKNEVNREEYYQNSAPVVNNFNENKIQNEPSSTEFVGNPTSIETNVGKTTNESNFDNEEPIIVSDSIDYPDEINIKDIENILNNASKDKKAGLMSVWDKIKDEHTSLLSIQILTRGKVVAVSNDAFIVVLADEGFCNRVMEYKNYLKIIEIFANEGIEIKDYICVPQGVWSKIAKDYKSKYAKGDTKPQLSPIRIGIKKRVVPDTMPISEDEKILNDVLSYFDDNQLKITED